MKGRTKSALRYISSCICGSNHGSEECDLWEYFDYLFLAFLTETFIRNEKCFIYFRFENISR